MEIMEVKVLRKGTMAQSTEMLKVAYDAMN